MTKFSPARFRKKPIVIEAAQWDGTAQGATPIIDWILAGDATADYRCAGAEGCAEPHTIAIRTLEGTMHAAAGDWIIRGVRSEFYPCKPDFFAATYEATDIPGDSRRIP